MVLTQFTDQEDRKTLKDFIPIPNIYAAGRLDRDSEGLLVLTNDGTLANKISSPKNKTNKTYWVQVEGQPSEADLDKLRNGVTLNDGPTVAAKVEQIQTPELWEGHRQLDSEQIFLPLGCQFLLQKAVIGKFVV
mgnify:CR=1 FL=1